MAFLDLFTIFFAQFLNFVFGLLQSFILQAVGP